MFGYLDRDIIAGFFRSFVLLFLLFQIGVFISVFQDQYQFAFAADENRLGWLLLYFLFSIPRQATYAIPFLTAACTLWVFTVKARQNELLAYLTGGVSPLRIARPLLIVSAMLSVAAFFTIELLATRADKAAERIERVYIQGRKLESITKEQNVFQKGQGERFYFVALFTPSEQRMEQPIVIQMNPQWTGPRWRLDAEYAQAVTGEDQQHHWVFHNVHYREFDEAGSVRLYEQRDTMRDVDLNPPIERELDRYIQQRFREEQMSTGELIEYIDLYREQNRPTARMETILHFNFALPFGTFVIGLVMCGHILRPRATGLVRGFGGGLLLMTGYFVVLVFLRQLSVEGGIPAIVAAWIPNVAFLGIGLYMLRRDRSL